MDNKYIDSALSSREFIELYRQIREKHELLRAFDTPLELVDFLHDFKQRRYLENDNILKILIKEYQERSQSPLIYCYFLKIFTPGLKAIFYQFRTRVREDIAFDDHDLKNQIRLLLFDILNNYDSKVKPTKIAVTIMSRIRGRLVFWHSKLKREQKGVNAYRRNLIQEGPKTTHSDLEYIVSLDYVKEKLNSLAKKGIIREKDVFIILSSRIYGKSLKELAKEQGENYRSLSIRRQRAEKKIRKFLFPKGELLFPYNSR